MAQTRSRSRSLGARQAAPMQNRLAPDALAARAASTHRSAAHELFGIDTGVVVNALRTIGAVFRAAAGLDREQRRDLHLARIEVLAMNALGTEQQLGERQREQRAHVGAGPVVANGGILAWSGSRCGRPYGVTMAVLRGKSKRPRSGSFPPRPCVPAPAGSTRAAQYLNSGIFPNGSSAGLVRRFAAASTNANGMNTTPSGTASSWRATSSMVPRRVVTRIMSPGATPSFSS